MKLKYKIIFFISLLSIFSMSYAALGSYSTYRYLADASSYDCDTQSVLGGTALCSYGDVDNLLLYTQSSIFQQAGVDQYVDGGRNDNSPWTISGYFAVYVEWYLEGTYFETDPPHSNHELSFSYDIYYMSGSTQHIVLSYEKEYSSSQDWDDDFVSHYMGTYTFSGTIDYYIEIQIHLQNVNRGTSDFNYGGNHMDFYRVRLFYPYGGE